MAELNLDGLMAFWNSLTPQQRQEMAKALDDFHALRGSLENRGLIECDAGLTEITILKNTAETRELIALLKKTGAQGIKVIKKRGKIAP